MRIDSSGNFLVGKTSSGIATAGIELRSNDDVLITSNGSQALYLNRLSSDGSIVEFRQAGTTVGSITSNGGAIIIGSSDVGVYFDSGSDRIIPVNVSTNSVRNDAIDIGGNPHRFKDLYLSGGVYLGGTGSANKLDDYEEGTWTPNAQGSSTAGSFSANNVFGQYTKIGNTVHVWFDCDGTMSGASGSLEFTGLPFACNSAVEAVGQFMFDNLNVTGSKTNYVLYVGGNSTTMVIFESADDTGWTVLGVSNENFAIRGQLTYKV
jgi:hypothetical protein